MNVNQRSGRGAEARNGSAGCRLEGDLRVAALDGGDRRPGRRSQESAVRQRRSRIAGPRSFNMIRAETCRPRRLVLVHDRHAVTHRKSSIAGEPACRSASFWISALTRTTRANASVRQALINAGIPIRHKTTTGINHWKMMLYAGQARVHFTRRELRLRFVFAGRALHELRRRGDLLHRRSGDRPQLHDEVRRSCGPTPCTIRTWRTSTRRCSTTIRLIRSAPT